MYRIDVPSNTNSLPTPLTPGTEGYFKAAADGTPQTIVTNDWANSVQEEIISPIDAVGIARSKTDNKQLAKAIQSNLLNYGVTTNSGNSYSVTYVLPPYTSADSLIEGAIFRAKINATNTAAATLSVNGGSALNIKLVNGLTVAAGNLRAGMYAEFTFDGTNLILLNPYTVAYIAQIDATGTVAVGDAKFTNVTTATSDPFGFWNSTTKRFTTLVAGRYRFTLLSQVSFGAGAYTAIATLYKNGSPLKRFYEFNVGAVDWVSFGEINEASVSANDYYELWVRADTNSYTIGIQMTCELIGA